MHLVSFSCTLFFLQERRYYPNFRTQRYLLYLYWYLCLCQILQYPLRCQMLQYPRHYYRYIRIAVFRVVWFNITAVSAVASLAESRSLSSGTGVSLYAIVWVLFPSILLDLWKRDRWDLKLALFLKSRLQIGQITILTRNPQLWKWVIVWRQPLL